MVRTKEIISFVVPTELPEQVQKYATANKGKPVVRVKRVLPYAGRQVVVENKKSATYIGTERHQHKQ